MRLFLSGPQAHSGISLISTGQPLTLSRSPRSHCLRSLYDPERWRDAYLARRQFERQSPGQRFDGAFRGSVQQRSPHRMRTDDEAEVDDAPAVGPEPLDRLLHRENRPQNVDVVVEVKALFGDLREGAEAEHSGIVDQNVQSSERGIHFFE